MQHLVDIFLHLDKYLDQWAGQLGPWLYVVLFAVIFAETGLVILPFLPGDSLLFAIGALAAKPDSVIQIWPMSIALWVAAVLGDAVNYAAGYRIGPVVFRRENSRFLNKDHLLKAQKFYEKYGGKTIILARFIPIIRTFAPFVAGIGKMSYRRFATFNVVGGAVWVFAFTFAGHYFGKTEMVQKNFHYVIVAIIVISVLPAVFEIWRARREARATSTSGT